MIETDTKIIPEAVQAGYQIAQSILGTATQMIVNPLGPSREPATATRDFRITKMLPPDKARDMYPAMWLFEIVGPGYPQGHLYVANELSCGTHLIKILQTVRDAAIVEQGKGQ